MASSFSRHSLTRNLDGLANALRDSSFVLVELEDRNSRAIHPRAARARVRGTDDARPIVPNIY